MPQRATAARAAAGLALLAPLPLLPSTLAGTARPGGVLIYARHGTGRPATAWYALDMASGRSAPLPGGRCQPTSFGDRSRDGRWLAFSGSCAGAPGEVVFVQRSTDGLVRTVTRSGWDSDPAFSPDGQRLVYVHYDTRDGPHSELHVVRLDGTGDRTITPPTLEASGPTWSPDGTHIAFLVDNAARAAVYTIRADGRDPRQWTHPPLVYMRDEALSYSPDGRRLLFERRYTPWRSDEDSSPADSGETVDLLVLSMSTGRVRRLLTPATIHGRRAEDSEPAWSPDGARIAFTRVRRPGPGSPRTSEILLVQASGRGVRRLVAPPTIGGQPAEDADPVWAPDGTRVAFDRTGGPRSGVWTVSTDGSGARQLTSVEPPRYDVVLAWRRVPGRR